MTQDDMVIQALKQNGGYATLRRLYELIDFSNWKTKTPEKSVNCIVQRNPNIFRIQPGLWALEECRNQVMQHFRITETEKSKEVFSHSYYQGLLVEIGKMSKYKTFVPAQDKNKVYLNTTLGKVSDTTDIPHFSYFEIIKRARTVDVIWFNERKLPRKMFEVEHTTDIKNSLEKFYELQDFYIDFTIVADKSRKNQFDDIINRSIFSEIKTRVGFLSYDSVAKKYNGLKEEVSSGW